MSLLQLDFEDVPKTSNLMRMFLENYSIRESPYR